MEEINNQSVYEESLLEVVHPTEKNIITTTGYAIFAENMLETAKSVASENKLKDAAYSFTVDKSTITLIESGGTTYTLKKQ